MSDKTPAAIERNTGQGQMDKSELRIRVAELREWKQAPLQPDGFTRYVLGDGLPTMPPDYPSDLNACHEFEEALKDHDKNMYVIHLSAELGLAGRIAGIVGSTVTAFKFAHASAEQRCRAFVAIMEASSVPKRNEGE